MERKPLEVLVFLTQSIGALFYIIFLAAFYIPMPSNDTLIGDPTFRTPLSLFGGIFLILTIISLVVAYVKKQEE